MREENPGVYRIEKVLRQLLREEEGELTVVEQVACMIFELTRWLPEHRFRVVADGAYASLHVVALTGQSRIGATRGPLQKD